MPTFQIRHLTAYRYRNPVAFGDHRFMLRPRDGTDQRVTGFSLTVDPKPKGLSWSEDPAANVVGIARFGRRARELRFLAEMTVETSSFDEGTLDLAEHACRCPFAYGAEEGPDLSRFVERQWPDGTHAVDAWARSVWDEDPGHETWRIVKRINAAIRRDFAYLRREEPGIQPPHLTLRLRRGSCRDFAALLAEALRTLGLAARFVSGYLHVAGDGDMARAGGATHAWVQVYLPGAGWIDLDPTSGAVGNRDLVRVACVREPSSASPLSGSFIGFPRDLIEMSVSVDVRRMAEPGVRKVEAA